MEIINREKKEMVPLTHNENNFYNKQEYVICEKKGFVWIKMIRII